MNVINRQSPRATTSFLWKENWPQTREHFVQWWQHDGLLVTPVMWGDYPPRNPPWADVEAPAPPATNEARFTDPAHVAEQSHYRLAHADCRLDALPIAQVDIGPGSLAAYLGSEPGFGETTIWFEPCIEDPEQYPTIRFDPGNRWWRRQLDLIDAVQRRAAGRYLVGCPDLVENLDVLASLREAQRLMIDMIERPDWVKARLREITDAYFAVYNELYSRLRDADGGMAFWAFSLWGPGRTAKVQCDAGAMISREMFDEFVAPELSRQCAELDYAMFHLDGTQAIQHLDSLVKIEDLDAIEYTAQVGVETGGNPRWWPLYRRILESGKSVQVLDVRPDEMAPLLDAIGTHGVYIHLTGAQTAAALNEVEAVVERYRAK